MMKNLKFYYKKDSFTNDRGELIEFDRLYVTDGRVDVPLKAVYKNDAKVLRLLFEDAEHVKAE